MKIGFIQTLPVRLDRDANLRAVESALSAVGVQVDLWVLPELFASGYLFRDRDELASVAEQADGTTSQRLGVLAKRFGTSFVAGFPERSGAAIFNSAMAVDSGGVRGVYRKTHLFDREKEWFDPGDSGFVVVQLGGVPVGIMICYDWRFPESTRTLALAGARVVAHPSNLVLKTCQDAMVTRALENGVFTITANRVGSESVGGSEILFTGRSRIVGPDGTVLADGPPVSASAMFVEIDPSAAGDKTVTPRNDLFADRRPDFYKI